MKPVVVSHPKPGQRAQIRCPSCGLLGGIDQEQYEGRISIVCPNRECEYHETHDLRESKAPEGGE